MSTLENVEHLRFLPHPTGESRPHARFGNVVRSEHVSKIPGTIIAGFGALILAGWFGLAVSLVLANEGSTIALVMLELFVGLVGLLGLSILRIGLRSRRRGVTVYEHGLVFDDAKRHVELAWNDTEGVRSRTWSMDRGALQSVWWIHVAGKTDVVEIDRTIPHHREVGAEIERRIEALALTRARWVLSNGGTVYFGPVWLHPAGLGIGNASCSWDELDAVVHRLDIGMFAMSVVGAAVGGGQFNRYVLALRPRHGMLDLAAVPTDRVLNLGTLFTILRDMGKLDGGTS
jgi:hypothetical protein